MTASTTQVATTLPTTQVATTLPTAQVATTLPTTQVATTLPTTQVATNLPTTQVATTLPTTQVATTLPTTQVATTLPTTQVATNLPTTQVTTNLPTTIEAECKDGYQLIAYTCIRVYLDEKNYSGAKEACRKDGATLAMPKTKELDSWNPEEPKLPWWNWNRLDWCGQYWSEPTGTPMWDDYPCRFSNRYICQAT
ncbi:Hypp4168 [Branchiostoma lanceolatum]|uniref:Hypp4168 protein n=1 Tax=Branchiostoma lanceolatum TaxID=7740 RepID=A0A8K0A7T5_BRALA|nr:Hypp4168 [Branchiostoma lanceolatum]